jgi:hypothetical protein
MGDRLNSIFGRRSVGNGSEKFLTILELAKLLGVSRIAV